MTTALPLSTTPVASVYDTFSGMATNVRSYCEQVQSGTANGGSVSASLLFRLLGAAKSVISYAATLPATSAFQSALTAYVQQQVGDPTLDVLTSYQTSLSALNSLISAIAADYPKDAAGHTLDRVMNATTGDVTEVSVTGANLPTTLPAISAWLSTIS